MARPLLEIDPKLVERLATIHCTVEEIASVCECHPDTITNRFSDLIKCAREKGKTSLRRWQWGAAQKGNTALLIWLGKQILGQKDISRIELHEIPDDVFAAEVQRRIRLASVAS